MYLFLVSPKLLRDLSHFRLSGEKKCYLLVIFKFALFVAYMSQPIKHGRDYGYIAHIKILTPFEPVRFIICELVFAAIYC